MINIMKEAHKTTKKIVKAGDNYRATLGLVLKMLYTKAKAGKIKITKKLVTVNNVTGETETLWSGVATTNYNKAIEIMREKHKSIQKSTNRIKFTKNSIIAKLDVKEGTITKTLKYTMVYI